MCPMSEISPEGIAEINLLVPIKKDIFMKIDSGIKASQKSRDQAIRGDFETINILESLFVK